MKFEQSKRSDHRQHVSRETSWWHGHDWGCGSARM